MPTRSLSPHLRPFGPHTNTKMKVEYPTPGITHVRPFTVKVTKPYLKQCFDVIRGFMNYRTWTSDDKLVLLLVSYRIWNDFLWFQIILEVLLSKRRTSYVYELLGNNLQEVLWRYSGFYGNDTNYNLTWISVDKPVLWEHRAGILALWSMISFVSKKFTLTTQSSTFKKKITSIHSVIVTRPHLQNA